MSSTVLDQTAKPTPAPAAAPCLLAVDGNSLVHRAFHANARLGFTLGATPAWAVRGLLSQLVAAVDRSCADAVVVGFDDPEHSLRRETWPHYKAQRPEKLDGLTAQLQLAAEVLTSLGVSVCVPSGLEADDVLASAAAHARAQGWRCVVTTSDRDAFALIDDNTRVLRILNGGVEASPMLTPERLELLTGVAPHHYRDLAALRGDPSDNLPGVKGVGPRKAVQLLQAFGSVEAVFADAAAGGERLRGVVGKALAARLATPEAQQAWRENREVMAMRPDVPLSLEHPAGVGALPLPKEAVVRVFTAFDLFLPNGLRALCGIEGATPDPRDTNPNWQPWVPRSAARFPPLPKAKPNPFTQDRLF